ncbi:TetR family transcriptional regulator [Robertmurraya siralis]|uniref:TetR family transcriptional regulator n=1 Tax=Robertmurraya siralis TaxID=77777 RepID=A0A919WM50_9BACI|nr:TetR/AcrR family transcriptional regulator [Robertmurraya siralis]PAE20929.1 TetR family transcriptional regulator [Bacillus sp. 7504-2]GIN64152.1 TetR family transcriptional regulator [Robertmurraya siralis]
MKDRKQHVIKMAHQLFIDKGFQATSIQDILDYSGIAKGTFYNYFSSKNELLIALFTTLYKQMEKERNELLIGQDPSDIEIFIKQMELQLEMNRSNNLTALFEEVYVSNDEELKQFIKIGSFKSLRWLFERFVAIFGEDKKPYLLDCASMFMGILSHMLKNYSIAVKSPRAIHLVVRYSVNRIAKIIEEVSHSGEQLLKPELLDAWSPNGKKNNQAFQQALHRIILSLKKPFTQNIGSKKQLELLDFIYEELINRQEPRLSLIESVLDTLKKDPQLKNTTGMQKLEKFINEYVKNEK